MSNIINSNFKKWFGNSKVVDSTGAPLIVYHGTSKKFDKFDLNKVGTASDTGMFGKGFYFTTKKDIAQHYARGGDVLSLYVKIVNPYIISKKSDIPFIEVPDETIEDMRNADKNYSELFRAYLIKEGYDGVMSELHGDIQIVALYPNQIKSATDNNGNFSKNDNIYEQRRYIGDCMNIKLMEGQKVLGIDGKEYIIEKGDTLIENELHYSDEHKLELIDAGWTQSTDDDFSKTFKSGLTSGELNPTGKAIVYLSFDSSGRWIDVSIGFAGTDYDGRNYIENSDKLVLDIEKEIMLYLKGKKTRFIITGQD